MTSVLSQQLHQLSLQRGFVPAAITKGRPSILFDYQSAADVDLHTLHGVANAGLKALLARDGRYAPFKSSLFSEAKLQSPSREQQSKDWNNDLDETLLSFLRLLSIHFLLPPAFQVLEYLLRKYKINEYNVDAVMECILSYHATNEFVRVVQVLHLKGTTWAFLSKAQETGAALPRDVLVQRCSVDRAILKFICDGAKAAAAASYTNKTMLSFYTVIVFDFLGRVKQVDEELIGFILPYVVDGLKGNVMTDYRHSSYTILARIASIVPLSSSMLSFVLEHLATAVQPEETPAALRLLAHLASTQDELKTIPGKALKRLVGLPGFAQELQELVSSGRAATLVRLVIDSLVGRLLSGRVWAADAMADIAAAVPLADHAGRLSEQLIAGVPDVPADAAHTCDSIAHVLRVLDLRYAPQLDAAINTVLSGSSTQGGASASDARRARVFEFVRGAFQLSSHATLEGEFEHALTLSAALDAPASGMRQQAILHLDSVFANAPGQRAFVTASLLRKLRDEDLGVVTEALSAMAVAEAAPAALFEELSDVLRRVDSVLLSDIKDVDKKVVKKNQDVSEKALQLLLKAKLHEHSTLKHGAAALLLGHMLVTPRLRPVSHAAINIAQQLPHPLFAHLAEVRVVPDADDAPAVATKPLKSKSRAVAPKPDPQPPTSPTDRREAKAAADASLNNQVIAALARACTGDSAARILEEVPTIAAAGGLLCRHLLVLALLRAAESSAAAAVGPALAATILTVFRAEWPSVAAALSPDFAEDASRLLPPEHLQRLATAEGREEAHAVALRLAQLRAVAWRPEPERPAVFAELTALRPAAAFELHLRALVGSCGGVMQQLEFLSGLFAAPRGSVAEDVACRALDLAAAVLRAQAGGASWDARLPLVTLRVLCAMRSSSDQVRSSALHMAEALPAALHTLAHSPAPLAEHLTLSNAATALAAALTTLATHAASIRADQAAATQQLAAMLRPQQPPVGAPAASSSAPAPSTPVKLAPPPSPAPPTSTRRSRRQKGGATDAMDVEPTLSQPPASGTIAAAPVAAAAASSVHGDAVPALGAEHARALQAWMLHELRGAPAGHLGMAAAATLAAVLAAVPQCHQGLLAAALGGATPAASLPLRRALLSSEELPLGPAAVKGDLSPDEAALAMAVCGCIVAVTARDSGLRQPMLTFVTAAVGAQHAPGCVPLQELRLAVLGKLAVELKDLFVEARQSELMAARVGLLRALLAVAGGDGVEGARRAARAALEVMTLTSTDVLSVMEHQDDPTAKRKRRRAGADKALVDHLGGDQLDHVVAVLELMQWKSLVRPQELVAPLQLLVRQLAEGAAPLAVAFTEGDGDDEVMDGTEEGEGSAKSAVAGYALQLSLAVLTNLAKSLPVDQADIDIGGAVLVARDAPDSAARNAALQLLTTLALRTPSKALGYALQVVDVVASSAASSALLDPVSRSAMADVCAATLPPWLASQGGDSAILFATLVQKLPELATQHHRLLLSMCISTLPQGEGMPVAVLQLLLHSTAAAQGPAVPIGPDPTPSVGAAVPWKDQLIELAHELLRQVPPGERLEALARVLASSLRTAGTDEPQQTMPRLVVVLVTKQLQELAKRGGARDTVADERAQRGCAALMREALAQLHVLSTLGRGLRERRERVIVSIASRGLYGLVAATEALMPAASCVEAVCALLHEADDERMRRRLLRLLATKLEAVEDVAEEGEDPSKAPVRQQELARAALLLAGEVPALLAQEAATSAVTRQVALGTLGTAARRFGALAPEALAAAAPVVLAAARDESCAVRGSAMACIASLALALQQRMVPMLPQVVSTVLEVTEAAQQLLAGFDTAAAAVPDAAAESTDDENDDDEGGAQPMVREATLADRAVEVASGLAALDALLRTLGAFLSPYLPALLQLLLRPEVLRCQVAGCSEYAQGMRRSIPGVVPARLLLEPLFRQLPASLAAGRESVLALLRMASEAASSMEPRIAAAYHDQFFVFILKALDVRQVGSLPPHDVAEVEAAAVEVLLALVMKLSERQFKPLFLRLLAWASITPDALADDDAAATPKPLGRLTALFTAAAALGRRLKAVFVPYLRYLLDAAVQQLGGVAQAAAAQSKKKRKRAAAAEVAAGDGTAAAASGEDGATWLLRLRVLRTVHRCLLHDTVGFLTAERFERLLPVLVAQLEVAPPQELQAELAEAVADDELDSTLLPAKHCALDPVGRVAVAALVQLALTSNSDAMWKPLQHQTLMMTRAAEPRTRLAALEAVGQLAARLREEYLSLMPEALPFIAELLEDVEPSVEGRAQELVALLEEVSGEKLDQYLKA